MGQACPLRSGNACSEGFYRLERSITTPGSGLGLSLVAAVAELHGIELRVEDNAPGLRITMIFKAHQSIQPRPYGRPDDSRSNGALEGVIFSDAAEEQANETKH